MAYTTQNRLSIWIFFRNGFQISKEERTHKAILAFSLLYASQVNSYILFLILLSSTNIYTTIALIVGTFVGGVYNSYQIAQKIYEKGLIIDILNRSGNLSLICLSCLFGLKVSNWAYQQDCLVVLYLVFGFGFAPSIGLVFSQVKEKLPNYNRTFISTIICSLSFIAPIILAILYGLFNNEIIIIIYSIIFSLIALSLRKNLPEDAKFRINETSQAKEWFKWVYPRFIFKFKNEDRLNDGIQKIFYKFVLAGFNSFFLFSLFFQHENFTFLNAEEMHSSVFFGWAYAGLFVGTIYWGWKSKAYSSRKMIIFQSNLVQIGVFCIYILLFLLRDSISSDSKKWIDFSFIFLLGFNFPWAIMLTWASEVVLIKTRASLLVLLPNFYRISSILLIIILSLKDNSIVAILTKNINTINTLIIGIFLLLISIISAASIPDNFGKEEFPFDYSQKSLVSTELRDEINSIEKDANKGKYLESAAHKIAENFKRKDVFGNLFYLTNIYFRNDSQNDIISHGMNDNLDLINESAYLERECYAQNLEKIAFMHTIADVLTREKMIQNFTDIVAKNDKIKGMMYWRSGLGQILQDHENPNFENQNINKRTIIIDLSHIDFEDERVSLFPKAFEQEDWKKEFLDNPENWYKHLVELKEIARFSSELEGLLKELQAESNNFDMEKIKLLLIHYRLDASFYPVANYFRYCIKPYTRNNDVVTLMTLKTACALDKKRIGQLRDLITALMLEKTNILNKKQYKELSEANTTIAMDEEHYKKHELDAINKRLYKLKEKVPELQKQATFYYTQKGVQHLLDVSSFYMKIMKHIPSEKNFSKMNINLRTLIREKLDIALNSLDLMSMGYEHIKHIEDNLDKFLLKSELIPERCHASFDKTALQIIVAELIKNGIRYSDKGNPIFKIQLIDYSDDRGYYLLEFKNNAKADADFYAYMNDSIVDEPQKLKVNGGIRSIKRILKYYEFTKWQMGARESKDGKFVVVYLQIPKDDIMNMTPTAEQDFYLSY